MCPLKGTAKGPGEHGVKTTKEAATIKRLCSFSIRDSHQGGSGKPDGSPKSIPAPGRSLRTSQMAKGIF